MIGNNFYNPNFQQSFQNPYQERLNAMQGGFAPRTEITRVNGENGARTYPLAPNSSVLLLDENAPIVWLAQSDGAGYKTVTPYTIAPYEIESQTIDVKTLEQRIVKLEEFVNGQSDSAKPTRKSDSK